MIKESWERFKKGENYWFGMWLCIAYGIISILILPSVFCMPAPKWLMSFPSVGDTIGGIAGPLIALLAVFLTFMAFWIQYQANIKQTEQFNKQDIDVKIQRFENKFYEMLRIHIQNVEFMDIENGLIQKRKVFTNMFYEYRFIYHLVQKEYRNEKKIDNLSDEEKKYITNIAYVLFLIGVGYTSDKVIDVILDSIKKERFYVRSVGILKEYSKNYKHENVFKIQFQGEETSYRLNKGVANFIGINTTEIEFRLKYKPFNGHQSRLSHYYRNLFAIVRFVHTFDDLPDKIDIKEKRLYLKMLRAQLSTFEQLLLYYNCQSVFGTFWDRFGFIRTYRLIKNIPLPYADFGVDPTVHYKDAILEADEEIKKDRKNSEPFFEWGEEIQTVMESFNL